PTSLHSELKMAFQIFVRGLEGKTTTYNDITSETKIKDIKKKVKEKIGIDVNEQRLIFVGKQLEDDKTAGHYNIVKSSTLHLVVREKRHDSKKDVELTTDPDMITLDDDPKNLRAKMPCGHAIGAESLTAYCRSLVSEGKFQFYCPYIDPTSNDRCYSEWQYADILRIGLLNDEEREYFETKISENYSFRALGVQECPQCSTFCERIDKNRSSVICIICSRKPGAKEFAFCWYCLHEVKSKNSYRCDNNLCEGIDPRLVILKNAAKKEIGNISGVPSLRACPKSGTIIEHESRCKHMRCPCGQEFCLRNRETGAWPCGAYNSVCNIAPLQTTLPN
ncbi:7981_t:CDS:2, partial [Acaulospora morrowiae]